MKQAALAMFDPMLRVVAEQRDAAETPEEVSELLTRMHGAFSVTARRLRCTQSSSARGSGARKRSPATKGSLLSAGARGWVRASGLGGYDRRSRRSQCLRLRALRDRDVQPPRQACESSPRTPGPRQAAAKCLAEDREMAATIDHNWENVLTLTLAG